MHLVWQMDDADPVRRDSIPTPSRFGGGVRAAHAVASHGALCTCGAAAAPQLPWRLSTGRERATGNNTEFHSRLIMATALQDTERKVEGMEAMKGMEVLVREMAQGIDRGEGSLKDLIERARTPPAESHTAPHERCPLLFL